MEGNLGKKLRAAREAAGLTIDDAVYRAKLPRSVVVALEAEDFGFFTSPLYARSFLKQYGDYVGMDVTPWLDELVPTALIDGEAVEAFIEIEEPSPLPVIRDRKRDTSGGGAMAAVWMILITGGLIWGGVELFREFERRHAVVPPPAQTPTAQATLVEVLEIDNEAAQEADGPAQEVVATEGPEPPRRAIIVREEE
jgi:cytoskeleton protein RodZ